MLYFTNLITVKIGNFKWETFIRLEIIVLNCQASYKSLGIVENNYWLPEQVHKTIQHFAIFWWLLKKTEFYVKGLQIGSSEEDIQ